MNEWLTKSLYALNIPRPAETSKKKATQNSVSIETEWISVQYY